VRGEKRTNRQRRRGRRKRGLKKITRFPPRFDMVGVKTAQRGSLSYEMLQRGRIGDKPHRRKSGTLPANGSTPRDTQGKEDQDKKQLCGQKIRSL